MRNILRNFARAIALLAAGAAAYYVAPVALRLMKPEPPTPAPLVAIANVPDLPTPAASAPADRSGDGVLINCLAALERRATVEAELVQSGYVLNQPVEIAGVYRQKGRGVERKFATLLQGRVASNPARLWQVSNGLFLYTDLSWGAAGQTNGQAAHPNAGATNHRRSVTRVDLRKIRQEIGLGSGARSDADRNAIGRNQAAALSIDPTMSAAFGGLPMLVESLGANFHFSTPRKMGLHNQPVFVMIGRWKPASRAALERADSDKPPTGAIRRLPDHVLLALGAADLFPYLIEYRGVDDALAAPGLTDDARLQQSGRPLLRMEFRRPRFDTPIADTQFAYPEAGSVPRRDITEQRLATLRNRQKLKIAARSELQIKRR